MVSEMACANRPHISSYARTRWPLNATARLLLSNFLTIFILICSRPAMAQPELWRVCDGTNFGPAQISPGLAVWPGCGAPGDTIWYKTAGWPLLAYADYALLRPVSDGAVAAFDDYYVDSGLLTSFRVARLVF